MSSYYAAGSPGTFGGPRQHDLVGPGYGATTVTALDPATGQPVTTVSKDWTDVLADTLKVGVTLYQTDLQRDALKSQQHAAARDAEALRQAQLDAARVAANQVVLSSRAPGTVVMAPGGGIPMPVILVGVAAVGAALFFALKSRRR